MSTEEMMLTAAGLWPQSFQVSIPIVREQQSGVASRVASGGASVASEVEAVDMPQIGLTSEDDTRFATTIEIWQDVGRMGSQASL